MGAKIARRKPKLKQALSESNGEFVPFWIETNQVFGMVKTVEEWIEIKRMFDIAYSKSIWSLRECEERRVPNFGQRSEHQGTRTLGQFFDQNKMERTD